MSKELDDYLRPWDDTVRRKTSTWTGDSTRSGAWASATIIDLTALGKIGAGYSFAKARKSIGLLGRLELHVCLLEADGPDGRERTLFVCGDLMAGSRWLTERLGRTWANEGLTADRIVIGATHTHSSPGSLFGNPFYDRFADGLDGFDQRWAAKLTRYLDAAIDTVTQGLEPARIGFGSSNAWGSMWNRSTPGSLAEALQTEPADLPTPWSDAALAFTSNAFGAPTTPFPSDGRSASGRPLDSAPQQDRPDTGFSLVDPRLRVTAILPRDGDGPLAVFASMAATPTLVSAHGRLASSDVSGVARRHVQRALSSGTALPVLFFGGSLGDCNVAHAGEGLSTLFDRRWRAKKTWIRRREDLALVTWESGAILGNQLLAAVVPAIADAQTHNGNCQTTVRFAEPAVPGSSLGGQRMADRFMVGRSVRHASEMNSPPRQTNRGERTHRVDRSPGEPYLLPVDPADPHSPKRNNVPNQAVQTLGPRSYPPFLPLRLVTLATGTHTHTFVGLPLEPSMLWGHAMESLVESELGGTAQVLGVCGEYVGYACTVREYRVQDYEASSVYWGRNLGPFIRETLRTLAQGEATPAPTGKARFHIQGAVPVGRITLEGDNPDDPLVDTIDDPRTLPGQPDQPLQVTRTSDQIDVLCLVRLSNPRLKMTSPTFQTRAGISEPRFGLRVNGEPLRFLTSGLPVDDRYAEGLLVRRPFHDARTHWFLRMRLDAADVDLSPGDSVEFWIHRDLRPRHERFPFEWPQR